MMTQEEKELLLVDLCARLPYGVKVYNTTFKKPTIKTLYGKISNDEFLMEETYTSVGVDGDDFGPFNKRHYTGHIDFIKPYLRPMSSMTEEEIKELSEIDMKRGIFSSRHLTWHLDGEVIDYLNKKMLDWRGLILSGLALEAPEGMYNINEK